MSERRLCPRCGELAFQSPLADGRMATRCTGCGRISGPPEPAAKRWNWRAKPRRTDA